MQCLGPAPKGMYDMESRSDLDRALNLTGKKQDELYSKARNKNGKYICTRDSNETRSD